MRTVDLGVDAARLLRVPGQGRVCATFSRALYLQAPGGLVALTTTGAPRGPLHVRVTDLPPVPPGCPVLVGEAHLRIGGFSYSLNAPVWTPQLPAAPTLVSAREAARHWLPDRGPALTVGSTEPECLPHAALAALRHNALREFAARLGGRGPGLTPAGDDLLAGVLLVAHATCSATRTTLRSLLQCADQAPTNDIARALLRCAARGHCIEPAHELLSGLAAGDYSRAMSAVHDLGRFGSSSGAALTYGIRAALVDLPTTGARPGGTQPVHDQWWSAYSR